MSAAKHIRTLEDFARLSGVTLIECGPEWGGRVGYKLADCPSISYCGFRSKKETIQSWLSGSFGEQTAEALKALLKQAAKATGEAA